MKVSSSVWLEFNQNKLENDLFVKAWIALQGLRHKRSNFSNQLFRSQIPDKRK